MISLHIPDDWTTEQAYAVIDFVEALVERLRCIYGDRIAHDLATRVEPPPDPDQLDLPLLDDDICF